MMSVKIIPNDCVFCEIAAGEDDTLTVCSFEPLNPVVPNHRLFIPTVHVEDAAEVPQVAGVVFMEAAKHAQKAGVPFNLITSAGREATQSVFHFHVHYVPRYAFDGLHLPWTGQKR